MPVTFIVKSCTFGGVDYEPVNAIFADTVQNYSRPFGGHVDNELLFVTLDKDVRGLSPEAEQQVPPHGRYAVLMRDVHATTDTSNIRYRENVMVQGTSGTVGRFSGSICRLNNSSLFYPAEFRSAVGVVSNTKSVSIVGVETGNDYSYLLDTTAAHKIVPVDENGDEITDLSIKPAKYIEVEQDPTDVSENKFVRLIMGQGRVHNITDNGVSVTLKDTIAFESSPTSTTTYDTSILQARDSTITGHPNGSVNPDVNQAFRTVLYNPDNRGYDVAYFRSDNSNTIDKALNKLSDKVQGLRTAVEDDLGETAIGSRFLETLSAVEHIERMANIQENHFGLPPNLKTEIRRLVLRINNLSNSYVNDGIKVGELDRVDKHTEAIQRVNKSWLKVTEQRILNRDGEERQSPTNVFRKTQINEDNGKPLFTPEPPSYNEASHPDFGLPPVYTENGSEPEVRIITSGAASNTMESVAPHDIYTRLGRLMSPEQRARLGISDGAHANPYDPNDPLAVHESDDDSSDDNDVTHTEHNM